MKDECGGTVICEFIGLKSKMYSLLDVNDYEKSTQKGHNSNNSEFKDTLFNKKLIRHNMSGIKSINHILVTYKSNKRSLSAFDDKRYIIADGINSLSYGHKDIPK